MQPVTDRQMSALEFLLNYTQGHGYPPTIAEVAAGLGVTNNAASDRINALQRKGCVTRPDKKTARSITITKKGMQEWRAATLT